MFLKMDLDLDLGRFRWKGREMNEWGWWFRRYEGGGEGKCGFSSTAVEICSVRDGLYHVPRLVVMGFYLEEWIRKAFGAIAPMVCAAR